MYRRAWAGIAAMAVVLTACGEDVEAGETEEHAGTGTETATQESTDSDSTDDGADNTGDGTVGGLSDGYTVLGSLAELPLASDETIIVQTADLQAATELAGLERASSLEPEELAPWINPLTGVPVNGQSAPVFVPPASGLGQVQQAAEFHDLLGWSILDVDSYVEYNNAPYLNLVVTGEFTPDTLSPDLLDLPGGVRSFGEGDDLSVNPQNSSAVSRIGNPIRLGQLDGRIMLSHTTAAVSGWLQGGGPSMADHAGLAAVATAVDEAGAVSAMLTSTTFSSTDLPTIVPVQPGEDFDFDEVLALAESLPSFPFDAVGIGWSASDQGEAVITVAYHFGSPSAAASSESALEDVWTQGRTLRELRPFSDWYEVEQVTSDGPVASVTLRGTEPNSPAVIANMLMQRELVFMHQ